MLDFSKEREHPPPLCTQDHLSHLCSLRCVCDVGSAAHVALCHPALPCGPVPEPALCPSDMNEEPASFSGMTISLTKKDTEAGV